MRPRSAAFFQSSEHRLLPPPDQHSGIYHANCPYPGPAAAYPAADAPERLQVCASPDSFARGSALVSDHIHGLQLRPALQPGRAFRYYALPRAAPPAPKLPHAFFAFHRFLKKNKKILPHIVIYFSNWYDVPIRIIWYPRLSFRLNCEKKLNYD